MTQYPSQKIPVICFEQKSSFTLRYSAEISAPATSVFLLIKTPEVCIIEKRYI
jgi:hypothetical protein